VLLLLGVPDRAVMDIMGWSNTAMAKRYQHVTDKVRHDIAKRVDGLIWEASGDEDQADNDVSGEPGERPQLRPPHQTPGRGLRPARRLCCSVAVAAGFEPAEGLPPHTLSRRAP